MKGRRCVLVVVVERLVRDVGILRFGNTHVSRYMYTYVVSLPRVSAGCTSSRVTGHASPAANAKGQAKGARILQSPYGCINAALFTQTSFLLMPDGLDCSSQAAN
jgi:hypothetical protein